MAKVKALEAAQPSYCCQACGHVEAKWLGRCPACQEWNSLVEEIERAAPPRPSATGVADGARADLDRRGRASTSAGRAVTRGIGELDRVLGGGLVAGCMVLLGGDPGVGKSTLLIQALAGLAGEGTVLYATGEESVAQTAMRARRVGAAAASRSRSSPRPTSRRSSRTRAQVAPAILAVDSIQTVYTPILDSIPGSLAQVRECASRLMQFAKTTGHADDRRRPRHQGRRARRARRRSSTSSTSCSSSRATAGRTGSCARTRTGSARRRRSACSRCAAPGMAEVANPSAHLLGRAAGRRAGLGRRRVGRRRAAAARRDPGAGRAGERGRRPADGRGRRRQPRLAAARRARAARALRRPRSRHLRQRRRRHPARRAGDRSRRRVRDRVVGARPRDRRRHDRVRRGRPRRRDPRGHAVRAPPRRGRAPGLHARARPGPERRGGSTPPTRRASSSSRSTG